ncbi:DNA repair protein RecN [Marinicauda pacifica]|uniref:DNA repair protein RecN n=1 Tax=Marinicauda pacifica TaxID=1133559 RepID=A0A4S2HB59_9PROT|nr:DNA repair protein RecN [Marinicauda pacifica]TGY92722.1 DNA repair protein RecN [Marinicauda pacifica]GGE39800.1 DNA repair protein RecN [Marinicauda pacifica]
MLISLSIRDIVLIDRLDLQFDAGLSALTGETGAGKSILLGALGLACGDRADRAMVRSGAEQGGATAVFEIAGDHPALALLDEAGIAAEPGEPVILRRVVTADGRSRAHVNDQAASVGLLRSLGDVLVEIHGQHDGRGLLDPKTHRGLLDEFARNDAERRKVASAWTGLAEARDRVDSLRETRDRAASEEDFLRLAVEELDELDPREGEEVTLASERKFLQQAEAALSELQSASDILSGGEGMAGRLNGALRGLERVRDTLGRNEDEAAADEAGGQDDGEDRDGAGNALTASATARSALDRAASALDRALIEFNEAEDALSDAGAAFLVEPGRLESVEERLFALRAAARKHSVAVELLPGLRTRLAERLDTIEHADDRLKEAEAALKAAEADYGEAARALSATRIKAGAALSEAVMAELGPLKLDKAKFRVAVEASEDRPGAKGWDSVAFEVSTNPGAPFGPLDKIASGGELSRFALALKVCLAGQQDGLVMVFDEVDQGVGGAVADAVGTRLSRLAEQGQALVVTHSPQVAARAAHHWKIEKSEDGDTVRTRVRALEAGERREEIARMLSGAQVTEAARAAADQLMAS